MLGDSITQASWQPGGTDQALAQEYSRKLDVQCRGFDGYSTENALQVAPLFFANPTTLKLVILWFGANDAVPSFQSFVPLDRFRSNLHALVNLGPPSVPVLLMSPPPIEPKMLREAEVEFSIEVGIPGRLESVRKYAAAVGEVVKDVQKQGGRQIAFVDIHAAIEGAVKGDREAGCRKLMTDGCHLNADGYKIVTAEILKTIAVSFPQLKADSLPLHFSTWDSLPKYKE